MTAVATAEEAGSMSLLPLYVTVDSGAFDLVAACETEGVIVEYAGDELHVDGRESIALESPSG